MSTSYSKVRVRIPPRTFDIRVGLVLHTVTKHYHVVVTYLHRVSSLSTICKNRRYKVKDNRPDYNIG